MSFKEKTTTEKRAYWREYYLRNRARCLVRASIQNKARRERHQRILTAYKMSFGCERCGYRRCPAALEFHHTDPSTKAFEIGQNVTKVIGDLFEEVLKTEVLCANCHREVENP